jgi:hypothetical protein
MKTELTCPQCGQALSANLDLSGRRVRCSICGLVWRIPDCGIAPGAVTSTYTRSPMADVPSVAKPAVPPRPRGSRSSRSAWLEHVRPWAFEASQVQGAGTWLVVLSVADLLMTFALLRRSPAFFEANPIAHWFFARWNMAGMVFFKFSVIGGVILLSEIIERKRPGWGRMVLLVGCIGAVYAVFQGGRLYLAADDAPMAAELD